MAIRIGTQSAGGDNIRLDGRNPSNVYFGLGGGDTVTGFAAPDFIYGGRGSDILYGGDDNDTILAGEGRDQAFGGNGDDVIVGHGGFTFLTSFVSFVTETSRDILDGGIGNDRIQVGQNDVGRGGTGYDTLVAVVGEIGGNGPLLSYTLDFRDIGGAQGSEFGWGSSSARGFERVDVKVLNAAPTTSVRGTAGDDSIAVQTNGILRNGVSITGSRIYGERGDDVLVGSTTGNDSIYGGLGDDLIDGGLGPDILTGGAGGDIFLQRIRPVDPLGGGGTQPDIIKDFDPSRDMFLVQLYATTPTPLSSTLLVKGASPSAREGGGQFVYDTSDGRLYFDVDGAGPGAMVHLATLSGRPNITAANLVADNNLFVPALDVGTVASTGNATQRAGGSGVDRFAGTGNPDHFWGQSGRDTLAGAAGDDMLFGGRDNDRLSGGAGRDRLVGGFGADTISGGAGDDFIGADSGRFGEVSAIDFSVDVLSGGTGNDLIVGHLRDRIDGGAGIDRLQLTIDASLIESADARVLFDFSRISGATAVTIADSLVVKGIEAVDLLIGNLEPGATVIGSSGDDTLRVNAVFNASTQVTVINGGGGDDTLFGSFRADRMSGGTGDDTIYLGEGDTVSGGAGADIFVFSSAESATITDFAGTDAIVVVSRDEFNGQTIIPNPNILVSGITPLADLPGQAQFLFQTTTRALFIDYNGSSPGGDYLIGTILGSASPSASNLALEFLVV